MTETQERLTNTVANDIGVCTIKGITDILKEIIQADVFIVNGSVSLKVLIPSFLLRKRYLIIYHSAYLYARLPLKGPNQIGNWIRKQVAKKAFCNVSVSKAALHNVDTSSLRTAILLNPIDPELLRYKQSKVPKLYDLLFSGRVIQGKGIFLLIEALSLMAKRGLLLRLTVVGDGPDLQACKDLVSRNQIPVLFKGRIDKNELVKAYQEASLVVIPSTTHIEGNPLVLAESITLGTPVLVSDQPPMIEAAGNAGQHFRSGNLDALVSKLETLFFSESDMLAKMTIACLEEQEKFLPEVYKAGLQHILSNK
jgi:glycosyltransferase involved in cell wall biosynthesis